MRLIYAAEPVDGRVWYDRETRRFRASAGPSLEAGAPAARVRLDPPAGPAPTPGDLHLATGMEWNPLAHALTEAGRGAALRVLSAESTERVLSSPGLPPRLGRAHGLGEPFAAFEERLPRPGRPLRVAIVNFLHHAYGDAIVSLTVLRELRRRLDAAGGGRATIDLLQNDYVPGVEALYRRSGIVDSIHPLPLPLTKLAGYDAYWDFSRGAYDLDRPWLDALLDAAGIDPSTVPAERRRNRLRLDPAAVREVAPAVAAARAKGAPVVLVHPRASTPLRTWPHEKAAAFVRQMIRQTNWTVACATGPITGDARETDWSGASRSFDHFLALLASADAFVGADTAVYHAADALDVPGVVLFTTIPPELRVADYPEIEGYPLTPGNPLTGLHDSDDPAVLDQARALWDALDPDLVLDAVARALDRRRTHDEGQIGFVNSIDSPVHALAGGDHVAAA